MDSKTMDNKTMKFGVQSLLESNIQSKLISKETGINESIISKLRNQSQAIDETKHRHIRYLYDFYLKHVDEIEAQKGVPNYIIAQKLPKNVQIFLDNLAYNVALIQKQQHSRISKLFVYDEYAIDNNGNATDRTSYVEVNETVPVNKNGEIYPYHIAVKNVIENRDSVKDIKGLKINFNKEKLEIALKKYKSEYAKIKVYKTDSNGLSLKVTTAKEVIYGVESEYFEIEFNE